MRQHGLEPQSDADIELSVESIAMFWSDGRSGIEIRQDALADIRAAVVRREGNLPARHRQLEAASELRRVLQRGARLESFERCIPIESPRPDGRLVGQVIAEE